MLKNGAEILFGLDTVKTVIYRKISSSFNENTLNSTVTNVDTNIRAQITSPAFIELEDKVILHNNIVVEPEDMVFLLDGSQIDGEPELFDKIIDGSDTWDIYHMYFDPTRSLYRMYARRV